MSEVQEAPQVQPRQAQSVLTNENMAEFVAKKLGLADTSEAAPAEPHNQSEPTESDKEATTVEDRKQNPKLEKRFSEITKQREDARKEAQQEREARQSLEAKLRDYEDKAKPKAEHLTEDEPKPARFSLMSQYATPVTENEVYSEW